MSVAGRLKSERARLRLTQPDVARALGVGKTTVINWEKGSSSPDAVQLSALADIGVDVLYVVTGAHAPVQKGRFTVPPAGAEASPAYVPDFSELPPAPPPSIAVGAPVLMSNEEPAYLPGISPRERSLLADYRAADDTGRAAIDAVAQMAARCGRSA